MPKLLFPSTKEDRCCDILDYMRKIVPSLFILLGGLARAQDSSGINGNTFFLIELMPVRGMVTVNAPTADEKTLLGQHAAYMQKLLDDQLLLVAGPSVTDHDAIGIAIVQAPSADDARRILNNDPSVKGGVFKGEVRPFRLSFFRQTNQATSTPAAH
jgi:uncharacterized protein YciI